MKIKNAVFWSIFLILLVSLGLSIFGTVMFRYNCYKLGNEYLYLAYDSPDVDNAIIYLTKYKEKIEENNFNVGNCGLVFKTANRDMGNRYDKLVRGIFSLEKINTKEKLSGTDFNVFSNMKDYVGSLNVSIPDYLTANNGWYCFLFIHSIWVSLVIWFLWIILGGAGFFNW